MGGQTGYYQKKLKKKKKKCICAVCIKIKYRKTLMISIMWLVILSHKDMRSMLSLALAEVVMYFKNIWVIEHTIEQVLLVD